ncbi:hypothetical protein [Arthrobacter sp. H5]|uniref:hypothetical protein n=1 Tax=Arthrobacter sp. H5 TaxID=1267973 RepID=UPI0004BC1941|nr:hypothetical protein [Arthrobacter sp. H5]
MVSILIALAGIVLGTGLILLVITPILGYASAVAGAGPVAGGIIAYIITAERLTELGFEQLIVIPALVLGLQSLFGLPIANIMLRKYAMKLHDRGHFDEAGSKTSTTTGSGALTTIAPEAGATKTSRRGLQLIPERFQEPPILLLMLFVSASLASWLDSLTGLNYGVWALLFGLLGHLVGIFPARAMEKANSFGLGIASVIVVIMASLSTVTFESVVQSFWPVVLILAVGVTGISIGGLAASKLLQWDPLKGMPLALTALFGFPGDYLVCQEISRSVGRNDREKAMIFDELVTPMLVAGFATVTTASIVIASILIQTI